MVGGDRHIHAKIREGKAQGDRKKGRWEDGPGVGRGASGADWRRRAIGECEIERLKRAQRASIHTQTQRQTEDKPTHKGGQQRSEMDGHARVELEWLISTAI